ncbi:hypothetical protein QVD17_17133 [Tagetes erecta]|uniref:PHD-type domain-containing protein n=1 Tax=Tagetes erecta TaxID=13708 RepID=A0AAD8KSJ7_TARER|nr:hypothetical protein QVD17_17133 [Tagetes erecta]
MSSERPKRQVIPPKLDDYYVDPVVKHRRHPKVKKQDNRHPMIQADTIENKRTTSSKKSSTQESIYDDVCNLCSDGGHLLLCDSCPSAFHTSCLQMQNLPLGQWHCVYCVCKFCGTFQRRGELISEMTKFHKSCVGRNALNIDLDGQSFCGKECHEIYERLQRYMGFKIDLGDGFSCTLVRRYDLGPHSTSFRRRCNSKLANALKIMNECFEPSIDRVTQENMINNIVYNKGSIFRRLDYSSFFTAILEKDGNMVSAASIRIHANKLAEMPYIGTRFMHRHGGMCRRLLDSIETILGDLGVQKLVIPAASEVLPMWTNAFGYKSLRESTKEIMKSMSIVIFPGIQMLQKCVEKKGDNLCQIKVLSQN